MSLATLGTAYVPIHVSVHRSQSSFGVAGWSFVLEPMVGFFLALIYATSQSSHVDVPIALLGLRLTLSPLPGFHKLFFERERGAHPQPTPRPNETPLDHEYLKLLEERHRQQAQDEAQRGIDYTRAQNQAAWSLPQFAAKFAKLLGRKGGVSGLSTKEMERLAQFHHRHPRITSSLLEAAFQQAEVKTIPVIVFHLQTLYVTRHERNP